MKYFYENNIFSILIPGLRRDIGNIREETELKAREISKIYNKVLISMSSGLDCQTILHSFASQNLGFECSFLHLVGYNDEEFNQLKILESKYGFRSIIIQIDPYKIKNRIFHESTTFNIQKNQILQKIYLEHLPEDYYFLQRFEPYVHITGSGKFMYYQGLHTVETSRHRAFSLVDRSGGFEFIDGNSEFLYSLLSDESYLATLYSAKYFKDTFMTKYRISISNYDLWDHFIKPVIYGKYWKNELEYFPKYSGIEKIDFLTEQSDFTKHAVLISLPTLLDNMKKGTDEIYVQNYHV